MRRQLTHFLQDPRKRALSCTYIKKRKESLLTHVGREQNTHRGGGGYVPPVPPSPHRTVGYAGYDEGMNNFRPATDQELTRLNPGRPPNVDWTAQTDGRWWMVRDSESKDPEANWREFMKIKLSTSRWAKRHGWTRSLRRRNHGAQVWVRFAKDAR